MSVVNHHNLVISGIGYKTIRELQIIQKVNDHATAHIILEVDKKKGYEYLQNVTEKEVLYIGTPDPVYYGYIDKIRIQYEDEYALLFVDLISTSSALDLSIESKSFQRVGESYSSVTARALHGRGKVLFQGNNLSSDGLLMQYKETVWNFILGLSVECGNPVFVNMSEKEPTLYSGPVGIAADLSGSTGMSNPGCRNIVGLVKVGYSTEGKYVSEVNTEMINGELISHYHVRTLSECVPLKHPCRFTGKVMSAVVKNVSRDKVKVHLVEIDREYDPDTTVEYSYSTLYSSKSAGIYCMPLEGDPVRIFFPSEKAKDAFVSSSYTVRGYAADKEEKGFFTPEGLQIYFGKSGLTIGSNTRKKTFISLAEDGNIYITSEDDIEIVGKKNLSISVNEGNIEMGAGEKTAFTVGNSLVMLEQEKGLIVSDRIITR